MTRLPIYQVDAFSDHAFAGNPAGVCLLDEPQPDDWMQLLGREMNLSETAFLLPENDGFRLRWFTPKVEVALCGHATLASAHVLFETGRLDIKDTAHFYTKSGLLTATSKDGWIELDFPSQPVTPVAAPDGLASILGVEPLFIGKNMDDYMVEVKTESEVHRSAPDFAQLVKLPCRGIILTCQATTPGFDFVSRFFAPAVGVDEDPVTGSAHTSLTPFWCQKLGKSEMTAYQASERGGVLRVTQRGDRVGISGQAVTIFQGELLTR
jgi:PhzF family phenazine biosynthesis protein